MSLPQLVMTFPPLDAVTRARVSGKAEWDVKAEQGNKYAFLINM